MAKKSNREYELSAALMHADKRINMLILELRNRDILISLKDDLIESLESELEDLRKKKKRV